MNMQTNIAAAGLIAHTVDRKALANALQAFKATGARIIEGRNTVPILSCVLVEASRDKLTITGTDLDVMLVVELDAEGAGSGALAIDFDALQKAVKGARGDTVRLSDPGNGRAVLESAGATVRLTTRDIADFPKLRVAGELDLATVDGATLQKDIERLAPCISTEETRYYLNGVFFHATQDEYGRDVWRMAATDGHRLGRVTRDVPEGLANMADAIVPRKACAFMRRRGLKGADSVRIGFSKSHFVMQAGTMRLVSKLIDGTFPDYSRVIPSRVREPGFGFAIEADADALANAAKDVTAHCTERTKAFRLSAGEGWATAYAVCPDNGPAHAMLDDADFTPKDDGDEIAVTVNAGYLAELMRAGFKGQRVRMMFEDAAAPMLTESPEAPEFTAVIMPMRGEETPISPARIREMNRDALEIFAEDGPAHVATVAQREADAAESGADNAYARRFAKEARQALGKLVSNAVDLFAARNGCERYEARAVILAQLAEMKGERDPVAARAAAMAERAAMRAEEMAGPPLPPPCPVYVAEPEAPAQPEANSAPVCQPEPETEGEAEPEAVEIEPVAPVQRADAPSAHAHQPDSEIAALRALVADLAARVEAMEAERVSQPVQTRRTAAHERAVRRAWAERQARRAEAARADRAETMLGRARVRIARLGAVLAGRKEQIAKLGAALLSARSRAAVDLRTAGETPRPVAVDKPAQPAPQPAPVPEPACDDADAYAAAC